VGHMGCFKSLAVVNSAAVNMDVQVALSHPGVHSFRYMPRSGICGSYHSSIFSFLRDHHIAFHSHSSCTNLHSHQHVQVFLPPHPHQHLLLFVLLMIGILTGVRWNLNVVLICISFMAQGAEHFFVCLLAICASSFENHLFQVICPFIQWVVDSLRG
jgi:hypothetical protein